jgi:hypothetical protein
MTTSHGWLRRNLLTELYRKPLIDSIVYIYLYGIVIVVGPVDSVDKKNLTPLVVMKTRFAPSLWLDPVSKHSLTVDSCRKTYPQKKALIHTPKYFSTFWQR